MALQLITAPAVEPVSAAEAVTQTHLRTDADVDADLVDLYIESARLAAENETERQIITATWKLILDGFPDVDFIELPRPPLQSVTAVRYYDEDGVQQTLDASSYHVTGSQTAPVTSPAPMPGRVTLKDGESWPTTETRPDAVEVEFVAGYGDDGTAVPSGIKHAILVHAADSYAHRETQVVGVSTSQLSRTVSALLAPYRVT